MQHCIDCNRDIEVKPGRGRPPLRCQVCRNLTPTERLAQAGAFARLGGVHKDDLRRWRKLADRGLITRQQYDDLAGQVADADPDGWPTPDQGRLHDQISADANPAVAAEGLSPEDLAWLNLRPALPEPEPPPERPCSHCGDDPATHGTVTSPKFPGRTWHDLCDACRATAYNTGKLPTRRTLWFRRHRGATIPPALVSKHQSDIYREELEAQMARDEVMRDEPEPGDEWWGDMEDRYTEMAERLQRYMRP